MRRWKAEGLVEKAWKRLDPPTQDELARLLGVKRTNLSKMNSGDMWMTESYANRIVDVVPGITIMDLGAPAAVVAEQEPSALDRLESLAEKLAVAIEEANSERARVDLVEKRVAALEARRRPPRGDAKRQVGP